MASDNLGNCDFTQFQDVLSAHTMYEYISQIHYKNGSPKGDLN